MPDDRLLFPALHMTTAAKGLLHFFEIELRLLDLGTELKSGKMLQVNACQF